MMFFAIFFLLQLISSRSNVMTIKYQQPSRSGVADKNGIKKSLIDKMGMPFSATNRLVRKPMRNLVFWRKVIHIYSSYKVSQIHSRLNKLQNTLMGKTDSEKEQQTKHLWNEVHEVNSDRMMNLCLGLRGFYLKSGQFLGTRHDFMPLIYLKKLSRLHDDVPPLGPDEIKIILEEELGPAEIYFCSLDLSKPIGSASVAQVHSGIWKETGQKCAVKIQYPDAERLMVGDLKNLRFLAEFLQRTELKFDILSAIKELQKQIVNEFDFISEARNMNRVNKGLFKSVKEVIIPKSIFSTKKVLVMTYVDGENLCRLAEFNDKDSATAMPNWLKKKYGRNLLTILAKAWGEQIFVLNLMNSDPHPGNICINKNNGKIGLLDWGQVKVVSDKLAVDFSLMIQAMNSNDKYKIVKSLYNLGIEVENPLDIDSVSDIALTMLDTRLVPGYIVNPFDPLNGLKKNAVSKMPSELYFVVRTVQLLRGIAYAFDIDFSLAKSWESYALKTLKKHPELQAKLI